MSVPPVSPDAPDTAERMVEFPTPMCWECGQEGTVLVPESGAMLRQAGALVQVAFPDLPTDLREQVISGTHPACWTAMFGTD